MYWHHSLLLSLCPDHTCGACYPSRHSRRIISRFFYLFFFRFPLFLLLCHITLYHFHSVWYVSRKNKGGGCPGKFRAISNSSPPPPLHQPKFEKSLRAERTKSPQSLPDVKSEFLHQTRSDAQLGNRQCPIPGLIIGTSTISFQPSN